jgi:hypothetical protein
LSECWDDRNQVSNKAIGCRRYGGGKQGAERVFVGKKRKRWKLEFELFEGIIMGY